MLSNSGVEATPDADAALLTAMTAPRGTSSGCFVPWQPWGVGIGTGLFGHKMYRALAHLYFVRRRHGIGEGVADKVRAACSSSRGIPHSSTLDGDRRRNHEAVLGMLTNGALDKKSRRELHIVRVFGNRRLRVGASLVPSSSLQQLPFPKLYGDVDFANHNECRLFATFKIINRIHATPLRRCTGGWYVLC